MISQLISLLTDALAMLCLARCLFQYGRLYFAHPLAQFCCRSTDWLVKPLRRAVPPLRRWDSACILAALLLYVVSYMMVSLLYLPGPMLGWQVVAANMLFAALALTRAMAYVLLGGLLWRMLLSLGQTYSPLLLVLHPYTNRCADPLHSCESDLGIFQVACWHCFCGGGLVGAYRPSSCA